MPFPKVRRTKPPEDRDRRPGRGVRTTYRRGGGGSATFAQAGRIRMRSAPSSWTNVDICGRYPGSRIRGGSGLPGSRQWPSLRERRSPVTVAGPHRISTGFPAPQTCGHHKVGSPTMSRLWRTPQRPRSIERRGGSWCCESHFRNVEGCESGFRNASGGTTCPAAVAVGSGSGRQCRVSRKPLSRHQTSRKWLSRHRGRRPRSESRLRRGVGRAAGWRSARPPALASRSRGRHAAGRRAARRPCSPSRSG